LWFLIVAVIQVSLYHLCTLLLLFYAHLLIRSLSLAFRP
jgi:hypothetical protein